MNAVFKTVAKATADDPLEYVLSDATPDRYGDVIEPSGWNLENFKKNPIALFGHDSKFIVGRWKNVRVEKNALRGRLELMEAVSERLKEVHTAVMAGILRAVSVGFKPIEEARIDTGSRYIEQELVECSLVSVPANPNALQIAKQLNLSDDVKTLIFGESAERDGEPLRRNNPAEPGARKSPLKVRTMNLSEKIQAAETRLLASRDQLTDLVGKEDLDDETRTAIDEINLRIESEQETVATLKRSEQMLALRSDPPKITASGTKPFAQAKKQVNPVDYFYRAAALSVLSHVTKWDSDKVLQKWYGGDEETAAVSSVITKAAVVPATTTLATWAAELVQTGIADFLDSLLAQSVYPRLAAMGSRFTFGRNGIISIPSRSSTPTVAGSFVAEGAPIPVRKAGFTSITLTPKTMGVISTFTRRIAEHSTPAIEGILRQAMQEDTAIAVDTILLDATAASTTRPAGLRAGVGVTTAVSSPTTAFEGLVTDLKALVAVLTAANSLRSPVFIMNPGEVLSISLTQNAGGDFPFKSEVATGQLLQYPIIQSTTQTAGMITLLDAADFASATSDTPQFDVSDQATLHMEDTTPLELVQDVTTDVVAAPMRSLYQTDTLALRMLLDINWAMRRTGVVAWTESVDW